MKKLLTIFLLCAAAFSLSARNATESSISADKVVYLVGSGSNVAILAINWADTCLAWGVCFDDSITVHQMLDIITARDRRLSYTVAEAGWGLYLTDILFVGSANDTLRISDDLVGGYPAYWNLMVNGTPGMLGFSAQKVGNGDFIKFADNSTGVPIPDTYDYIYPDTIYAAMPYEAMFAASDVKFWSGNGANSAVLAINWNFAAMAWGVRFDDSITVKQMLDIITARDPRLSYGYADAGWGLYLTDILFARGAGDTLRISSELVGGYSAYWNLMVNGATGMLGFASQKVGNGDFIKFADNSVGHAIPDTYDYAYDSPIVAARGPFCDSATTAGSSAIAANDNRFAAWATSCRVERGYQDIAVAADRATYGNDSMAVGAVDMNDNLNVVSLGDAGRATVTFEGMEIYNGEGPDFAVFENAFDDNFLELAFVEVSSDGENFVRFPATSLTQTFEQVDGMGRIDPTFINNLAGKYRAGYGTPFDLDELKDSTAIDINHITHIRIVDVVGSIDPRYGTLDAFGNIVNDPYPTNNYASGFDLDGVGAINVRASQSEGIASVEATAVRVYPNPANSVVRCRVADAAVREARLYSVSGQCVDVQRVDNGIATFRLSALSSGIYMLRAGSEMQKVVVKH
ncbi:MAG: T9SS type A sorting domain-containing protein [Bacteroidales bacterium]|nr:T9SS type A sorting domain-containing protein [Bacteroidales bacterium]